MSQKPYCPKYRKHYDEPGGYCPYCGIQHDLVFKCANPSCSAWVTMGDVFAGPLDQWRHPAVGAPHGGHYCSRCAKNLKSGASQGQATAGAPLFVPKVDPYAGGLHPPTRQPRKVPASPKKKSHPKRKRTFRERLDMIDRAVELIGDKAREGQRVEDDIDRLLDACDSDEILWEFAHECLVRKFERIARDHLAQYGRPAGRTALCFLLPPFAVTGYGCGTMLLVGLLTLLGWIPGIIAAWEINKRHYWGLLPHLP